MKFNKRFKIGKSEIALDKPTYFIADIGANHDGDIKRAKKLIRLCAKNGADAVKFQHFSAKTIVSDYGFKNLRSKQSHQSKWKKSVFNTYKDASIKLEWTNVLKLECKKNKIDFFTSPYSLELVDYVNKYICAYKIGSGDISWHQIIEKISRKKKPVLLATGASTLKEVNKAVQLILKKNKDIVIMQCNTNYTADKKNLNFVNLNVLNVYKKKFPNAILGLSDHTHGHVTVLGAVSLGARVVEKHFTDDNSRYGPDHKFAMNPKTWSEMVSATRELEKSFGDGVKKIENNEKETVVIQRRSVRSSRNLDKGHIINLNDLVFLRPFPKNSLNPYEYKKLIGKKLKYKIKKHECLTKKHIK